jgi:hypothetical protein
MNFITGQSAGAVQIGTPDIGAESGCMLFAEQPVRDPLPCCHAQLDDCTLVGEGYVYFLL